MRYGFAVSLFGHTALLAWGVLSLSSPRLLDATSLESIPVDFVQFDELTSLELGVETAPVLPEPQPVPEDMFSGRCSKGDRRRRMRPSIRHCPMR